MSDRDASTVNVGECMRCRSPIYATGRTCNCLKPEGGDADAGRAGISGRQKPDVTEPGSARKDAGPGEERCGRILFAGRFWGRDELAVTGWDTQGVIESGCPLPAGHDGDCHDPRVSLARPPEAEGVEALIAELHEALDETCLCGEGDGMGPCPFCDGLDNWTRKLRRALSTPSEPSPPAVIIETPDAELLAKRLSGAQEPSGGSLNIYHITELVRDARIRVVGVEEES